MIKWLRLNWGLLLVLALAVVAAAPLVTRPGLPSSGPDAQLHVYRAAELGHTLRAGAFYPRWAPDLYYGYGYPIFNYYAPLSYYLANLFDLLPGIDIVGGVKGVYLLGFAVASIGAYLLGRELFASPAAGVLAAGSFVFAPFVVFIDPHARGGLAEHLAVCLLPLVYYAFRRLLSGVGGRGALLGSVLTLGALVLSHNLLGLIAGGLLLAHWVWEVALGAGRSRAGWGGLAFVLAAAVIAFFWLPFLLERDAIKLNVIGPGYFDFHEHFISLGELLAPSQVLDMGATAPHYRFNLGLAQWLLALPALVVIARPGAPSRRTLSYFVLAGLALVFLMLPASTAIWERVPGMAYLQFPWRLLGPANLMLAVCAASGVTLLPSSESTNKRRRDLVLAAALAAILLLALPLLYPPMWSPDFGDTSPLGIIEWERRSLVLGTTSTGDFLPVKAALAPLHPMPSLLESYAGPGPIDKVNRAVLPEGATLQIIEHGPLHDRFFVSTPKKFVLRLYTFYFPGWRAYVGGEEVEIEVAGPEGFITLWVPRGEHEVLVRFSDTLPRTAGWVISGVGLVMLVIALVLMRAPRTRPSSELPYPTQSGFPGGLIWLGGVLFLFIILKGVVIDPRDNWMRYTSPPGQAWAAQHELWTNLIGVEGGQITLLGYDVPRRCVRSGGRLPVVLYWHARAPLGVDYQSFVHLAHPAHVLWGQEDHLHPGGLPTRRWPRDKYVWDEYEIQILPGTPPGEYVLHVGLYSLDGGYRLQAYDEVGQPVGDSIGIASVSVERPWRQPRLADLDMTRETLVSFPDAGVTLVGYSQSCSQVTLPDAWRITLFWRADRDHPAARTRALVLWDAEGNEVGRLEGLTTDDSYPFEVWKAGEIVRDPLLFVQEQLLDMNAGIYRFGVIVSAGELVFKPEGAEDDVVFLGTIELSMDEEMEERK